MRSAWLSGLSFLMVSTLVGAGLLVAARLLRVRPRAESPLKTRTYECGEAPEGAAWMQFHARYYVVALFFVLFDVEAVFLFPWAVALRGLGGAGFVAAVSFVAVLMLGWLYAIRKDALRWQ
jgi:NADH:ubiquinone oxidoreductase subunit 3 (subunit A)